MDINIVILMQFQGIDIYSYLQIILLSAFQLRVVSISSGMMAMNRKLGTGNRIQTIENFVDTNNSVSLFHPTFIDKLIELVPVN